MAPFTGLSPRFFGKLVTALRREGADPVRNGRPWSLPLEDRVLLVVAYWRTNLTLRQLAPLFGISKSAADRIIDHLGPLLALQPRRRFRKDTVLIVDDTLVPTRDHTIAEQSKNYRYSTNHQVVIDAAIRLVVVVGSRSPHPNAGRWMKATGELDRLEALTSLLVRDTPRLPTEPRPHPVVDCYVVAPASANYVAKLATGIADNQARTQVGEALGTVDVPVVVSPRINAAHARHPAWEGHIKTLRKAGVELVYGADVGPLDEPRRGPADRELPWATILGAAHRASGD